MLSEERRREILEMLRMDGRVLVRDLSKRFRTSLITVRKDLESLHHQGLLERTHGGALPIRTGALQDQTLQEKERLHKQEKLRIAAAAVRMIRPGQVIILDSGTTTTAIARGCRDLRSLTIITNATNIAADLAGSSVEVILTGGTLRKNSFSLVGPLAEESLRKLSADMLFLAVDGGRAIWQGGVAVFVRNGGAALDDWLHDQGVKNIQNVNARLAAAHPWQERLTAVSRREG